MRSLKISKQKQHYILVLLCLILCLAGCGASGGTVSDAAQADAQTYMEGEYQVSVKLEGGSGKAYVASPTSLTFKDGQWVLELLWSSSNYDYMVADGVRYLPVSTDGGSRFEIILSEPAGELPVTADTMAMGTPHEIEYTLILSPASDEDAENEAQESETLSASQGTLSDYVLKWRLEHEAVSEMDLKYADGFSVDFYEDGSSLVIINGSGEAFFLLPDGALLPVDLPDDVTILNVPLNNIYLAASGAMDMFRAMHALDAVRFTGTNISGWDMPEVKDAMEKGDIVYAGKYSTPDYERLLAGGCRLAVENTMIYHAPEVKEQLENLKIPVLVEHTSYENEPLGRCEWIKLYGLLCGCEEKAEEAFNEQEKLFLEASSHEPTGLSVAFFYITQNGLVNVRRSYDYMAYMIGLAGGDYIFQNLGSKDANSPTISMQMEEFYAKAKDADILIYNGSMEDEINEVDELVSMNSLLSKFRAVESGNVFCARKSMYQASMEMGTILSDFRAMLMGEDDKLVYFYRLR